MYTAAFPRSENVTPWHLSFDDRMALLRAGSPRAAYYYSTPDTSTFRYRAYNIAQALGAPERRGASAAWFVEADIHRIGRVLDACDVLVICRNSLYNDRVASIAAQARARGRPVLFDVDDLVFDQSYTHLLMDTLDQDMRNPASWNYWFAYVGRVAATYALCDGALVTNSYLAARAEAWSGKPARVIPNFLNREQQSLSDRIWDAKTANGWLRDGRTHLGYFSGSPSHDRDFGLVAPALARLMDEDPTLWLRVVGFLGDQPELTRHRDRIETLPLLDFLSLQREIGAIEVNLVPLLDNPFTNCKSELKWFEAAVVGALTIASPTHSYCGVIHDATTGWLANSYGWESALREVLADLDGHRVTVGPRARAAAQAQFGWDRQAATIEAALFDPWPNAAATGDVTARAELSPPP